MRVTGVTLAEVSSSGR